MTSRKHSTAKAQRTSQRTRDPNKWGPTEVAAHLGCAYQRARNLMLGGVFGESTYDAANRRLTVPRKAVEEFKRSQSTP